MRARRLSKTIFRSWQVAAIEIGALRQKIKFEQTLQAFVRLANVAACMSSKPTTNDLVANFLREVVSCWRALPDKVLFCLLLAVWLALFQFLGNSTFSWVRSPSLFSWMNYVYRGYIEDSYCKYIPLVVLGLFWWKRKQLMAVPKGIWWPAAGLLVFGLVLHIVGYAIQQARVSIVAFVVGLYGLMGLVWGKDWLKASIFPYFLLFLMVPLGTMADGITLPLRIVVSKITGVISALLGIQVVQNGTLIYNAIQGYKYEVAAACSGLNSLIAFFGLTTIYAFVCFPLGWRRALVILAGVPVAVACNVLRLTAIVIAAESFGQQAGSFVHEKLGLVFYIPGFVLLIWIGEWLEKWKTKAPVRIEARVEAKPA